MGTKKKRRGAAFTDLRARLEEYADMKEDRQAGWYGLEEGEGNRNMFTIFPFSALRQMHSNMFLKIILVVITIITVLALNLLKMPLSTAILQNINRVTTTKTDFINLGRETLPALQRLWTGSIEGGWEKPVFMPVGNNEPANGIAEEPHFYMPVEGKLVRGFGLYEEPPGDTKMSYGILFCAPDGVPVYASAAGYVKEAGENPEGGFAVVLEHRDGLETSYGHLKELMVDQGEIVEQGQLVARAGIEQAGGGAVVYFEIRKDGRPLDPLPLLHDH